MALLTVGLSHHSSPVALRERLAFTENELPDALTRLRGLSGIEEAAILSTCNRTELFAVAAPEAAALLPVWWARERGMAVEELQRHLFTHRDGGSVQHVLRVA